MNQLSVAYPGLQRFGRTLLAAGLVGSVGFFAFDRLLPIEVPSQLREDRFQLAAKPTLQQPPKSPAYLELTDGALPARVPNFHSLEPASIRESLLSLQPGTEVVVLRPSQPNTWFNGYDILALQVGGRPLLSIEATLSAHENKSSGSLTVCLVIAATGILVLMARNYVAPRHDAA